MNLLLTITLLAVSPVEVNAAFADLETLPAEFRTHVGYVALDVPEEEQASLEAVIKVWACSFSSNTHLPSQLPQRIEGTSLVRFDLEGLRWNASTYRDILVKHYPYRPDLAKQNVYPLVISGLWFASNLPDPERTGDSQYRLLYGEKSVPKNLSEFQTFWKIDAKNLAWGFIEGNSSVAVNRKRTLSSFPSANRGGSAWGTFDFKKLDVTSDPLENLKPFTHRFDAQEWIAGSIKTAGRKSGILNVYFLNDAKGIRQEKAPADIVRDTTELRGVEIRNTISCIGCHTSGYILPTLDQYDRYFRSGAQAFAYDKNTQLEVEAFYETDFIGDLKASTDLYARGIEMVCGLTPEAFSSAFVKVVKKYDAELTLEQATLELGCTPEELKLALGYQSAQKVNIGAQLSQLGQGVPIPRERFEEVAYTAGEYIKQWKESK